MTLNQKAHLYLVGGYAYYICDVNIMEDYEYDTICRELFEKYDELIDYKYFHLIDRENLKASTAYTINKEQYPTHIVKSAEFIIHSKGLK